jgi:DNA-directed RNA polymerase subunit RPC12/RpoP
MGTAYIPTCPHCGYRKPGLVDLERAAKCPGCGKRIRFADLVWISEER